MAGEMPRAYFISYFSALGMKPAFLYETYCESNIK